jgi:hypothetical protein
MAFGRKKSTVTNFTQQDVSMMATKALAERRANVVRLALRLTGATPLLMHRWSQKAIIEMVGKMVGQPVPRPPKDLTQEYEDSWFRNTDGQLAIPCRIVKAAIVNGAITTGGVTSKAELKRDLRVMGYTSPIRTHGGDRRMDCRIASNNGTPDMRSRAVIPEGWEFDIVLQFPTTLTPDKVMSALEGAGSSIGLCDWRPERGGDYGTFEVGVLSDGEIDRILKDCSLPEEMYQIPPEFLTAFRAAAASGTDSAKKVAALVDQVNGQSAPKRQRKTNGAAELGADAE